ncbi:MAG: L-rhamnose mutarotase [Thermoanaerobaculia bacterium]|nr:L-rhamnose mutarotase [Thermoanaerobaculia bacterium]
MPRIAFKMHLFPGKAEEYQRRHDEIWPELVVLLKNSGISDYSIFLDENTHELFGVLHAGDTAALDDLPRHPVMQHWWTFMKDIMATRDDDSPVTVPLREVFYLK